MSEMAPGSGQPVLERRFAAKVVANLANVLISAATVSIAARALGASAYGRYEFLFSAFQQAISALDSGTSNCFYSRLSQRPRDIGLVRFYGVFAAACMGLLVVATLVLLMSPLKDSLWLGAPGIAVLLAAGLACAGWGLQLVRMMVDAHGLTVRGESVFVLQKAVGLALLGCVAFAGLLALESFLVIQVLVTALGIFMLWRLLARSGSLSGREVLPVAAYRKDFWEYSHPLLAYAVVGAATAIAERWLLQRFAGPVDQGYFGLANQVGIVCGVFTAAMAQLLMREFSRAFGDADRNAMRRLFVEYVPLLYAVAAFFSVFVAVRADDVVWLAGGAGYAAAGPTMAVMALYPMHQAYGQLSGSVFLATNRTAAYRNIGVTGMVAGLPIAYFLTVPQSAGGLGLGATGLALKMVLLQFVLVNVQLWLNARHLSLSLASLLAQQLTVPILFGGLALACSSGAQALGLPRLIELLLCGCLYFLSAVLAVLAFPRLTGLDRQQLVGVLRRVRGR